MAARKQTGKDAKGAQVPQASAPRMRTFVIMRGNMDNTADARKFNDIMVVAQFLSLVRGADVHVGKWSIVVTVVDEEGATATVHSDVMRYVDIQKAMSPNDVDRVVEALVRRMVEAGVEADKVGHGILRRCLEERYMHYDEWEGQ